ncbi:minichromosome maintenance protein 5 [Lathyrus oleraceus]|uniref:DNA helicase n=1 Tax=Pisum sativum TaxID=3888 RepID=A0A9D4Y7G7_PEA|nr:minichromosome maintenance protein 5 [Pisum sativum]
MTCLLDGNGLCWLGCRLRLAFAGGCYLVTYHIIKVHALASATRDENKTITSKEENWLKRYLKYCRTECHPRLSETAAKLLQNNYVKIRQDMRQQANETRAAAAIPVTVRQHATACPDNEVAA